MGEMTRVSKIAFGELEMPTWSRSPWSGCGDGGRSFGNDECV